MTERLQEILNRKPSKWGNLTVKEFEGDIKLLQERVEELERKHEYALDDLEIFKRNYKEKRLESRRYKQALGRVLDFYPGVPNAEYIPTEMLFEIKNIARKALEREG